MADPGFPSQREAGANPNGENNLLFNQIYIWKQHDHEENYPEGDASEIVYVDPPVLNVCRLYCQNIKENDLLVGNFMSL